MDTPMTPSDAAKGWKRYFSRAKFVHFKEKIEPHIPLKIKKLPKHIKDSHPLVRWLLAIVVIILVILLIRFIINAFKSSEPKITAIPVVIAKVRQDNVPVYLSALGAVTPTDTVTVKTQINGKLLDVLFKEGQMVKAGDELAEIDPNPYLALLTQYEGQLIRDEALLANARIDLTRYEQLYKQDSVSEQILETQKALVKQYEGVVKSDQGLLETVQVDLAYTRINSPIDGRVGLRLVDPGNFVQTSDPNGLVVINNVHPITVVFSIPEDNLPQVIQKINAGNILKVEAYDRTQSKLLSTGTLLTVDNQIDPTTGTIKIKGQFRNEDDSLYPNQFVNIKLLVDTLLNATVVPTPAIQHGPKGTFLYVVNNDNKVSVKPIIVRVTVNDETAICGEVMQGESVVVEGAEKLTEGSTVITSSQNLKAPQNVKSSQNPKSSQNKKLSQNPKVARNSKLSKTSKNTKPAARKEVSKSA